MTQLLVLTLDAKLDELWGKIFSTNNAAAEFVDEVGQTVRPGRKRSSVLNHEIHGQMPTGRGDNADRLVKTEVRYSDGLRGARTTNGHSRQIFSRSSSTPGKKTLLQSKVTSAGNLGKLLAQNTHQITPILTFSSSLDRFCRQYCLCYRQVLSLGSCGARASFNSSTNCFNSSDRRWPNCRSLTARTSA